jgi:hypothetical protein
MVGEGILTQCSPTQVCITTTFILVEGVVCTSDLQMQPQLINTIIVHDHQVSLYCTSLCPICRQSYARKPPILLGLIANGFSRA